MGYNDGIIAARLSLGLEPGKTLDAVLSQYRGYGAPYGLLVAVVVCAIVSIACNVSNFSLRQIQKNVKFMFFQVYFCFVVCRTYSFIKEKQLGKVTVNNAGEQVRVMVGPENHLKEMTPPSREHVPHTNSVHPELVNNHA